MSNLQKETEHYQAFVSNGRKWLDDDEKYEHRSTKPHSRKQQSLSKKYEFKHAYEHEKSLKEADGMQYMGNLEILSE